jgi:hypothetical protein
MVKFIMANTLIQFNGAYYEYGSNVDVNNNGLMTGEFESAFFADLVAAWILENTEEHMTDVMFDGVYRDDGILVFNKKVTNEEIVSWRNNFQASVNRLTQSEHLQCTVDIWDPDAHVICTNDVFPYLDMELYWRDDDLKFKVYLKPNQKLKYLNKGSRHTSACFKSIPSGVIRRLSILTSLTQENENVPINELYPEHAKALEIAHLHVPLPYSTLRESIEAINAKKLQAEREYLSDPSSITARRQRRQRDWKSSVFFCRGERQAWDKPYSCPNQAPTQQVWSLRVSMSYITSSLT